jgi:hypothetical protein
MGNQTKWVFGSSDIKEMPFSECLPHTVIWHSVGRNPSAIVTTYSIVGRFVTIANRSREDTLADGSSWYYSIVYSYTLQAALTEHQKLAKEFCWPSKIRVYLSIQANEQMIITISPLPFLLSVFAFWENLNSGQ